MVFMEEGIRLRVYRLRIVNKKNGFTLVETILSFAIISIVLVVFLTLFAQANRAIISAQSNTKAVYLAQSYMEKVYMESSNNNYATACTNLTDAAAYGFSRIGTSEEFEKIENGYYIKIKFVLKYGNLYRVLIRVYDNVNLVLMAQDENAYAFKG